MLPDCPPACAARPGPARSPAHSQLGSPLRQPLPAACCIHHRLLSATRRLQEIAQVLEHLALLHAPHCYSYL